MRPRGLFICPSGVPSGSVDRNLHRETGVDATGSGPVGSRHLTPVGPLGASVWGGRGHGPGGSPDGHRHGHQNRFILRLRRTWRQVCPLTQFFFCFLFVQNH